MKSNLNFKSRTIFLLAGGLIGASALIGCTTEENDALEQIEHQSAHQALGQNIQVAVEDLNYALGYLRTDTKFGVATAVSALDQDGEDCDDPFDTEEDFGFGDCEVLEEVSAEEQLQDAADGLIDELNARIFTQANIEEETDTEITYLVDGATFCADEQDESCADNIDQLQLRLAVTSRASGDIDISVLVGEARYNPLDVQLHRAKLAAELDLGELRPTIELIADIDDPSGESDMLDELPTLMEGRVRAELAHTAERVGLTLEIMERIAVSGNDWSIKADRAAPAARLSVDHGTDMIEALLALNPLDIQAPVRTTEYDWSEAEGEIETTTQFDMLLNLAGASFDLEYFVGEDTIEINNIGLGDAQSTLDIDGDRVVEVDLNPDDGRAMGVSISAIGDEGAEISVTPGFDLNVMLKLIEVQQHFDDLADWMLNDTLRITLGGATSPTISLTDDNFEVVEGTLTLFSSAENIDVEVSAGQCLLEEDDSFDGDFDEEYEEEHPFANISAGTCE